MFTCQAPGDESEGESCHLQPAESPSASQEGVESAESLSTIHPLWEPTLHWIDHLYRELKTGKCDF